jgi:HSP20 family molecular chaperone IbpA
MQNRENNPYDDIFANISKIVEEIIRNMPEHQNARIVGYTIISRGQGEPPCVVRVGGEDAVEEIPYEVVESDDAIFITAELPPETKHAPYADIRISDVRICVDDDETVIPLGHAVDVIHSHYRVHRGVMDITLRKIPPQ